MSCSLPVWFLPKMNSFFSSVVHIILVWLSSSTATLIHALLILTFCLFLTSVFKPQNLQRFHLFTCGYFVIIIIISFAYIPRLEVEAGGEILFLHGTAQHGTERMGRVICL